MIPEHLFPKFPIISPSVGGNEDVLNQEQVRILDQDTCHRWYNDSQYRVDAEHICVGDEGMTAVACHVCPVPQH